MNVPFFIELHYLTLINTFLGCVFEYKPLYPLQVCSVSCKSFEEFKASWSCYFYSPSVRGADTFWRVRGIIGRFNRSRRNISSGVEKTADESISYIKFWTTSKGNLTNYYFLFRKPESFGTELKNVVCYRLGTMLYLWI